MDDKQQEQQYTNGYNNGYILSRFEPQLYKQVTAHCDSDKPYFKGMIEGHKAHEQELFLKNLEQSRKVRGEARPKMR